MKRIAFLLVFLISHFAFGGAAYAESGARVMLVLDASGSMWGKIGEETKIGIARRTVAAILDGWRPQDQLGLVVYGHRTKGACNDIEVMKEAGPLDAGTFAKMVGGLSPKGRTPMTEAVRVAAETLKSYEGKSTVILVSDGIETCGADPCAVASALKAENVGLVVHTVGFDIRDEEAKAQLSCIADRTGGKYYSASDSGALLTSVQEAVAEAKEAAPAPPPPPAPKAETAPPKAPVLEYNTVGTIRLAEGDDPLPAGDDTLWEFRRPAPEGQKGETVAYSYKPDIKETVPPGEYDVVLRVGSAEVKRRLTIAPDTLNRIEMVLNAGRIGLRAKRTETETQVGQASWDVRSKASNEMVFYSYVPEASGIVPAGDYIVSLEIGAAKVTKEISVAAGDTQAVEIVAGVGKVEARIVFSPDGPSVKEPASQIYPGETIEDGETSIAYSFDNQPKWDIPAGIYTVRVEVGGVKRDFPLVVEAGQTLKPSWALDAGLLSVKAAGASYIEVFAAGDDIYGDLKSLGYAFADTLLMPMPAGKVKVVATVNDEKIDQEVTIEAGKRKEVTVP